MQNNIVKTKVANNNTAIIACYTGEYCLANFNYCSEDGPNFPDDPAWANLTIEDFEALQTYLYDNAYDCILAIPTDQLQSYFDQILAKVKETLDFAFSHNGHLGDDTFYDYFPDAHFMLYQLAFLLAKDSNYEANKLMNPITLLIERYDTQYPNDELLIDQLYTAGEVTAAINDLNNL